MALPRRNVELKARDPDPERSLERCVALGAEDRGELRQRDTYFAARRGRLKLREQEPGAAELIAYERADAAEARESRYRIAPGREPPALREALDAALGTVVVVDKRRRLLLWEGVGIHLDRVEGLGAFVELEGVAADGSGLAGAGDPVGRVRGGVHRRGPGGTSTSAPRRSRRRRTRISCAAPALRPTARPSCSGRRRRSWRTRTSR